DATIEDLLAIVRDYPRYREYYKPVIVDSKLLGRSEKDDRFSIVMLNQALFLKTAVNMECEKSFSRVDGRRWYSVTDAVHLQEIQNYGQRNQQPLPLGEGAGYLWRMRSISRWEERDGGVYVESHTMVLSRPVLMGLHWLVEPLIRRVLRGSLV